MADQAPVYDHYLGEIRMVSFNYAPYPDWALCNGQKMGIAENTALFSLLGTTYGGDGQTYFNLPNLQGRMPLHAGSGHNLPPYVWGQSGGSVAAPISSANLPQHNHSFAPACGWNTPTQGNTQDPTGAIPGLVLDSTGNACTPYTTSPATGTMLSQNTGNAGSINPAPIPTVPPYLAINFIIALVGIYPQRG